MQETTTTTKRVKILSRDKLHVWLLAIKERQKNNRAQPKMDKQLSFLSHFPPFNCCLSVIL